MIENNVEKLNKTLFAVKKIFDDAGIEFFLSRGTLLQIYRSGKFNTWDDDIDVASFADVSKESVRKKILDSVIKNSFNYNRTDDAPEFRLGLCRKDYMPVGVAFWREVNDFIRESNTKLEYDDIGSIKELREIEFLGEKFLIPNKPEYLLEMWYGDWKQIAKKGWCTIDADGKYKLYEDQAMGYRALGVYQYYIKCDSNGDFLEPLEVYKKTLKKEPANNMYRVGLTFGVFDLFHEGHINLLKSAKYKCKKLIVCISMDDYVIKNKEKKPVDDLAIRIDNVINSGFVDVVNIQSNSFGKADAVKMFKPDALFVGDDWNRDTYTGEGLGLPVIYLPYTKGISSTGLRKEMKNE